MLYFFPELRTKPAESAVAATKTQNCNEQEILNDLFFKKHNTIYVGNDPHNSVTHTAKEIVNAFIWTFGSLAVHVIKAVVIKYTAVCSKEL